MSNWICKRYTGYGLASSANGPPVINQIRDFLLERGIIVRSSRFLRQALPDILAKRTDVLSPRMVRIVADLASEWRQLDERIKPVTDEIETLAKSDDGCRGVMTGAGTSARSSRVRWLPRSATARRSQEAGIFRHGSGLSPSRCRPEIAPSSGASPSAVTVTYARSSYKLPVSSCCGRRAGRSTASEFWLARAAQRLHRNVLAAALANKLARIAWTVLAQERSYEARITKAAA